MNTKVNRKTPLLENPLVDLNIPEADSDATVCFHGKTEGAPSRGRASSPRKLIRWLILFLCLSAVSLVLALWDMIYPAAQEERTNTQPAAPQMQQVPEEAEQVQPSPQSNETAEDEPLAQEQDEETSAEPTDRSQSYEFDSSMFAKEQSPEWANRPQPPRPTPAANTEQPPAPVPPAPAANAEQPPAPARPAPAESAPKQPLILMPKLPAQQPAPQKAPAAQRRENQPAPPEQRPEPRPQPAAAPPVPHTPPAAQQQPQVQAHYCPTPADMRKASKGGRTHALLEQGVKAGCPTCRQNLDSLNNR